MSQAPLPSGSGEVLTFRIGNDRLALPSRDIVEIIRPRALTRVPHAPNTLAGVVTLRGQILPVISLTALLGNEAAEPSPTTRIIVVDRSTPIGLIVDQVAELTSLQNERELDLDVILARDFGALMRRGGASRTTHVPTAQTQPAQSRILRNELSLIGLEVAGQEYALPLDKVAEITILPGDISAVPHTDQAMMGVMARRQMLLPLVSLRVLLGLPLQGFRRDKARVVVTRVGNALVGLVADGMKAILRVPEESIDPVPPVLTRGKGEAQIEGICRLDEGRRLISILSPARLFDSETAARILADAEQGTAQMSSTMIRTAAAEQFVVFRLGAEHYGLPIASVDEIVRRPDHLTRVPRAPSFVEGVISLRGRIVPVIDQHQRFSVAGESAGRGRRIVVVTIDTLQAGFVVDAVSEVLSVPADELMPAPELTADDVQVFDRIADIERDGRMILLIDPKALLNKAERDVLAALTAESAPVS